MCVRRDTAVSTALASASLSTDIIFEKKRRDDSSIGWKKIRATRAPSENELFINLFLHENAGDLLTIIIRHGISSLVLQWTDARDDYLR